MSHPDEILEMQDGRKPVRIQPPTWSYTAELIIAAAAAHPNRSLSETAIAAIRAMATVADLAVKRAEDKIGTAEE